jgi:hypothetical protein
VWQQYYDYKQVRGHLSKTDHENLKEFVEHRKYECVVSGILSGKGLSIPRKILVNKMNGRKRVVYSFRDEENMVLKLLAYLLYRYDSALSPVCYSFRRGFSAQKAIRRFTGTAGISEMWCYRLDIRNYFNSISIPILLPLLKSIIVDDEPLYDFFCQLLSGEEAIFNGEAVKEARGVMAGTPTSQFFANIYLTEADMFFEKQQILYARYSDDIIVFAKTEKELTGYRDDLKHFLYKYDLSINEDKETVIKPGEAWEFLGIEYQNGNVCLSSASKRKLKGKIRRKARAIHRWKIRKNAGDDRAVKAMIRAFNKKFYENGRKHELTWSRWFFPIVTDDGGFKEIDNYLQQYIRYIPTGCHGKKNYKTTYGKMKQLGFRGLVNEYYKYKQNADRICN